MIALGKLIATVIVFFLIIRENLLEEATFKINLKKIVSIEDPIKLIAFNRIKID